MFSLNRKWRQQGLPSGSWVALVRSRIWLYVVVCLEQPQGVASLAGLCSNRMLSRVLVGVIRCKL